MFSSRVAPAANKREPGSGGVEAGNRAGRQVIDRAVRAAGQAFRRTVGAGGRHGEPHAEIARKAMFALDDARFDQHLAGRPVDGASSAAICREPALEIGDEQQIGARIGGRGAAFGQHALRARTGQQTPHVLGVRVVQLESAACERLEIGGPRVRFETLPLARGQVRERRDPDHIAVTLHRETVDVEQGIERGAPRHLVEPQRDGAAHSFARDDVQPVNSANALSTAPSSARWKFSEIGLSSAASPASAAVRGALLRRTSGGNGTGGPSSVVGGGACRHRRASPAQRICAQRHGAVGRRSVKSAADGRFDIWRYLPRQRRRRVCRIWPSRRETGSPRRRRHLACAPTRRTPGRVPRQRRRRHIRGQGRQRWKVRQACAIPTFNATLTQRRARQRRASSHASTKPAQKVRLAHSLQAPLHEASVSDERARGAAFRERDA